MGVLNPPRVDDSGNGWILDIDYVAGGNSLHVLGPVPFAPFNGQAEGGPWCYVDGPAATYTWRTASPAALTAPNDLALPAAPVAPVSPAAPAGPTAAWPGGPCGPAGPRRPVSPLSRLSTLGLICLVELIR